MMVSQMGFSKLGQVAWQSGGGPSFVGQSAGQAPDCSGHTADLIDAEVKDLVERSYRCVLLHLCVLPDWLLHVLVGAHVRECFVCDRLICAYPVRVARSL